MALDLGKLVRSVRGADLIVSPQYNRYLLRNPECFPVRPDIAQRIYDLITTPPRNRSRSFSSSSAGTCHRRQVFDFLGVTTGKDVAVEPQLARIFANGTWSHMRTQVALLQAGILDNIEVSLTWPKKRARGSVDGVGTVPGDHPKLQWRDKEFLLEFKTANPFGYRNTVNEGPGKYRKQAARYALMGGYELIVIIVEDKANQELTEWVLEPTASELSEQRQELDDLNAAVDTKTLPPMLPECAKQTGEVFRKCPYGGKGGTCVRAGAWPTL